MKAKDIATELPELSGSLSEKSRVVIEAMASGELTPDDAGTVMQTLAIHAKIVEVDDHAQRIQALEESLAPQANKPWEKPRCRYIRAKSERSRPRQE